MEQWIPVIIAGLTTVSAILAYLGKRKASGAVDILVGAIKRETTVKDVKDRVEALSIVRGGNMKGFIDKAISRLP